MATAVWHARNEHGERLLAPSAYYHSGDLGDVIAALPALRAARSRSGRPIHLVLGPWSCPGVPGPREPIRSDRFNFLAPLLRVQPYLDAVFYDRRPPSPDAIDMTCFRRMNAIKNLLSDVQAVQIGLTLPIDYSPWLTVPDRIRAAEVVLIRSHRYRNTLFSWRRVLDGLRGRRCCFLGIGAEWEDFKRHLGPGDDVTRRIVSNALEYAMVIAGCDLVVCNQTFGFWVAAGLGKEMLVEGSRWHTNAALPTEKIKFCYGDEPA